MARGSSRSSSSSGGGRKSAPAYFGSSPSRSSHSSATASRAPTQTQTRTAAPQTAPPPALQSSHPPAASSHQSPPAQQQQYNAPPSSGGGGGLLSGLAGTVMQGMAFGGGSAIAHRAVDSIAGPRTVIHEHQGGPVEQEAAQTTLAAIDTGNDKLNQQVESQCNDEVLQFQKCLRDNNNNLNQCSFFFDVLSQCQRSVKDNAQWK